MTDPAEIGEAGLVPFTAAEMGNLRAGTVGICCVPGIGIGAEIVRIVIFFFFFFFVELSLRQEGGG